MYDKYNGNYHIRKSGHVCAGTHSAMVLQKHRLLFELPTNFNVRDKLLNLFGVNNG